MVDLDTLSIVLTGVGLIVAIIYYAQILRNTSKARQRELIIQRSQSYNMEYTRAYMKVRAMTDWKDAEDWYEKYGNNPESGSTWLYIMRLYAMAGLHLREGADPELLFELYPANAIMNLWERFEPVFRYQIERSNDPRRWESLEYLYNEAKKRYPDITPSWR